MKNDKKLSPTPTGQDIKGSGRCHKILATPTFSGHPQLNSELESFQHCEHQNIPYMTGTTGTTW